MPVYDRCNCFGILQFLFLYLALYFCVLELYSSERIFPNSYATAPGIEPVSLESSKVAPWPGTFEGRFADWATAPRQYTPFLSDKKLWSDWKTQKATILQHLKRNVKTLCQIEACFEPARIRTNNLQHKRRPSAPKKLTAVSNWCHYGVAGCSFSWSFLLRLSKFVSKTIK